MLLSIYWSISVQLYALNFLPVIAGFYRFFPLSWQKYFLPWQKPNPGTCGILICCLGVMYEGSEDMSLSVSLCVICCSLLDAFIDCRCLLTSTKTSLVWGSHTSSESLPFIIIIINDIYRAQTSPRSKCAKSAIAQ